ncbi:ABC transporter permease [Amnibacterium flavum]|uniref:Peptide ABC transporter permease n=1 Tax=Amnibacterium flavum TaxID=2173173 RepID=A0A2V1HQV5_9MICO|nr:ABC transporter permease [Amnibacterium flavum]PVZ94022.1 peptide ABC transporter permease [Amnibacterium flavum]
MSALEVEAVADRLATHRSAGPRHRFGFGEILAALFLLFVLVAAIAPALLSPTDPLAIDPGDAFSPPSLAQIFGTDESGRNIYSRVVHGAASSLVIGVSATVIGLGLGVLLGVVAGLGGRVVDFGVNRLLEVLFALPGLLLALFLIVVIGPGVVTTTLAVGISTAPGYARIIRAQLIAVRSSAYVEAATVQGRGRWWILRRHLLPNTLAPLLALGTLGVGQAIVWASALSFLGLGAVPPSPEWGAMLAAGRTYLSSAWWMSVFPGLFIVLTAVCATVLGRGVQRRTRQR